MILGEKMNTISESELINAIKDCAVKRINLIETPDGAYRIQITPSHFEGRSNQHNKGEKTLITTRHTPREWANLDRLVRHIHNAYGKVPEITLTLCFNPVEAIVNKVRKSDEISNEERNAKD